VPKSPRPRGTQRPAPTPIAIWEEGEDVDGRLVVRVDVDDDDVEVDPVNSTVVGLVVRADVDGDVEVDPVDSTVVGG
jgi:hypothetical protein